MPMFRKSRKQKSGRTLTKTQKLQVKRLLNNSLDVKTRYGAVPAIWTATPNLLTPATANDITNITRYDGAFGLKDQCRMGDQIRIKSIRLLGAVRDVNGVAGTIRVMVVRHAKSALSSIVPNDVIQTNAPSWSAYSELERTSPYTVLYDRKFNIGYDASHYRIDKTLYFKNPLLVKYLPAATGGTPAEIEDGNIELLVCADTSGAGSTKQDWLTAVVKFIDV